MLSKISVSDEDFKKLMPYFKTEILEKGDTFIVAGKRNDKVGFLEYGYLVATYISEKGKEEVSQIYAKENGNIVISSHESYYYDSISTETVKAVQKTKLLVLTKKDINEIISKYPEFETVVKEIAERSYIKMVDRIKQFQSYTAKERIEIFFDKHKVLFNVLSKKHIASFLGINRNDFTRYLSQILKK